MGASRRSVPERVQNCSSRGKLKGHHLKREVFLNRMEKVRVFRTGWAYPWKKVHMLAMIRCIVIDCLYPVHDG